MKFTTLNLYNKYAVPFISFFTQAILVWYIGPLIAISNQMILASPVKRLYVILILFLFWVLKFLLSSNPATDKKSQPLHPDIVKKITRLRGRFKGAIDFLKKTSITNQGKRIHLAKLPWYLLIGPQNAGKTTLLAQSTVNFILEKQFKDTPAKIPPSDHCNWWATREAVFVDTPGHYFTLSDKAKINTHLWDTLLNLIKTSRTRIQLKGVVIAFNLPQVMNSTSDVKQKMIADLKKRSSELFNYFGKNLNIHLIITKCDLLPGFTEFFSESSIDEMAQAWGFTIPPPSIHQTTLDIFHLRFNALVKRLNKQLITRLHHERNEEVRPLIKDFPLHVERLKESLSQLMKMLLPQICLQSVYLTSGTQLPINNQADYLTPYETTALTMLSSPIPTQTHAYFIRQWLSHHLPAMPVFSLKNTARLWQNRLVYTSALSLVVIISILLGRDFNHSIKQTHLIQYNLLQYQLSMQHTSGHVARLINVLPLLNALAESATQTQNNFLLAFYSKKSALAAEQAYQQALQTIVLPEIKNTFETYLENAANKNPEQVYAVFKAYLMLADKTHFNADYIANVLQSFLKNTTIKTAELVPHIQAASFFNLSFTLNQALIDTLRKQLTSLSDSTLGFILLKNIKNNNIDSEISLGTHFDNPLIFKSVAIATRIPAMYTAKKFEDITTTEIETVALQVTHGNWVLGKRPTILNSTATQALAAQLRAQYIAKYVDIWESLLANLQLNDPQNLTALEAMIARLTSNHSPLIQVLDTIKQNTAFTPIMNSSPSLQSLSFLLMNANNSQVNGLYQIFMGLKQLDNYLKTLLASPVPKDAITNATLKRMQDPNHDAIAQLSSLAEQSSLPMKTWLNLIAARTWELMLSETSLQGKNIQN